MEDIRRDFPKCMTVLLIISVSYVFNMLVFLQCDPNAKFRSVIVCIMNKLCLSQKSDLLSSYFNRMDWKAPAVGVR